VKTNNENEARKYWEFNYNPEFRKELMDQWHEIEETLVQPENLDDNLDLRNTVALEKIAHYLKEIAEDGILTYNGELYINSKKDEAT